jgi:hypothetical protein
VVNLKNNETYLVGYFQVFSHLVKVETPTSLVLRLKL